MNLEFDPHALEDLHYWVKTDQRKALRIFKLLKAITLNPLEGLGKPEKLKYTLENCWSRRIDREHRIVYMVEKKSIVIFAGRYHY